jgi:hypothetical protein
VDEGKLVGLLIGHGWSRMTIKLAIDMCKHPEVYASEIALLATVVKDAYQSEQKTFVSEAEQPYLATSVNSGAISPAAQNALPAEVPREEIKEFVQETIQLPPQLQQLEVEYDDVRKKIVELLSSGTMPERLNVEIQHLKSDVGIARITADKVDIERVRQKLDEIRKALYQQA